MLELAPETAARPLHERIAAAVRHAVADRALPAGTRLPAASELAQQLSVNVNTVLRAYRELTAEDTIELRRGRGATVRAAADRTRLLLLADALLDEAARLGITRGELAVLLAQRS